jgi:hypothetical protein
VRNADPKPPRSRHVIGTHTSCSVKFGQPGSADGTEEEATKVKARQCINWSEPNWEPILYLARIYVDEFMWTVEIELKGGKRLQAYKHYWTRRYIHLDDEANAFEYRGDDLYRQVHEEDLRELFDLVVRRPDPTLPLRERFEREDEWQTIEGASEPADPPDAPF